MCTKSREKNLAISGEMIGSLDIRRRIPRKSKYSDQEIVFILFINHKVRCKQDQDRFFRTFETILTDQKPEFCEIFEKSENFAKFQTSRG